MQTEPTFDGRILVVDDQMINVKVIDHLLSRAGYTHIEVQTNPERVVAVFSEFQPDLVILDLHMAPFDGIEVMTQLRPLLSPGEYLPFLILTGDITKEARERALGAGAMDFVSKPFNSTEILLRVGNLLQTRSLHLALQQERDSLEIKVQERTRDLEEAQHEVLQRLAFVAEYRDYATGQHIERVSRMVKDIALKMSLPTKEAELMGKASLLHDVGKIGIPDDILLKPGPLTDEQFAVIKNHTKIGGDILRNSRSSLLKQAEEIARYHHERWDGTGYLGLSQDSAPLSARITAVADVYDALITKRTYKEAWPPQKALSEITDQSGSHFDPKVVEAFLKVVQTDRATV